MVNLGKGLEVSFLRTILSGGYAIGSIDHTRPLKRAIQRYLVDALSTSLLEGKFKEGQAITADISDDTIIFQPSAKKWTV